MLELFSFFLVLAFFLMALSAISIIVASLLGYYALVTLERITGRGIFPGRGRFAFSFVLGIPIAYFFSLVRQYGYFAFLFSFSMFLAIGVYSFLRLRPSRQEERPSRLRRHDIADFEEERPVRKFKLKERQKVPLKMIELDGREEKKKPEAKKESGSLFGFLESIPNPLKNPLGGETSVQKSAKEFVLTRFGEKGSVERTWESGGKTHALVKSSGGRYTLTLNSENVVVDWDKD